MIEISTIITASAKDVWDKWNDVESVKNWAFASEEWSAEGIENDVRTGGKFKNRNFAKDGSAEFMFAGTYAEVVPQKRLAYTLDDGRKVEVNFEELGSSVKITQRFEPENENPEQMQRQGWQAYLDNFRKFVERGVDVKE